MTGGGSPSGPTCRTHPTYRTCPTCRSYPSYPTYRSCRSCRSCRLGGHVIGVVRTAGRLVGAGASPGGLMILGRVGLTAPGQGGRVDDQG